MWRQNLILFARNIRRNKTSFFINLIGLSTGLACALLIYLWVQDELLVDKFHEKDRRLFQVMLNMQGPDGIDTWENTPGLLAQALAEEMPEVEYAAAVIPSDFFKSKGILSFENLQLKANEQYVSNDYFHIFSYRLIQGDINQLLPDKNAVLISDEMAMKLFNTTENVIGKTIDWKREIFFFNFSGSYLVSGIFETPPSNSTCHFDLIFSYELFFEKWGKGMKKWTNQNPLTFLVLKEGTNVESFNKKIKDFIKSKDSNAISTLFIRRYSDKYLYDKYENGVQAGGRIMYVRLFSVIALFILVIACINFMNLSTAQASMKLKEVGVKKTVGASRTVLILQYLGGSILMAFLSLFVAIVLVEFLLPQFNEITGKHLSLNPFLSQGRLNLNFMFAILGITLLAGFVSASYPAFYLSGFSPASVLKGKLNTPLEELLARKGLVIFQFIISVVLIVSVLVVYKQIEFIQTKNLGFDKENVLCMKKEGKLEENIETFLQELKNIPGVVNASNSSGNLTGFHSSTTGGITCESWEKAAETRFASMDVNYDFFETMGIEITEGRTFSKKFGSENSKIIFNQTGIKIMGLENPVGKTVNLWGNDMQIIGVVRDFHFESFYNEIKPCFFKLIPVDFDFANSIWIRIRSGNEKATIDRIHKLYNEFNPGIAFEYSFFDADYQSMYESETRISALSKYFSAIAIIISCLGLFGLATYTAQRRFKEIGIRKVFGSSAFGIIRLLSGDFSKLVLVAILIALPVGYLLTRQWLNHFAYRINLAWWFFGCAALITFFIAWITVGSQSIRAASINPAECLKEE
jgi:putative ABC transport system permease protein